MLNREQTEQAADLILEHWRTSGQIAALPEEIRPASREEV